MLDIIILLLLGISGIIAIIGAVGLLRFPDFYTRIHAATIVSMGGMAFALIIFIIQTFWSMQSAKLLFIIIINMMALPSSTHIIAKVAYDKGIKPKPLVRNEWKR